MKYEPLHWAIACLSLRNRSILSSWNLLPKITYPHYKLLRITNLHPVSKHFLNESVSKISSSPTLALPILLLGQLLVHFLLTPLAFVTLSIPRSLWHDLNYHNSSLGAFFINHHHLPSSSATSPPVPWNLSSFHQPLMPLTHHPARNFCTSSQLVLPSKQLSIG